MKRITSLLALALTAASLIATEPSAALMQRIRPPHSPTPIPCLTVHGVAGAKANS